MNAPSIEQLVAAQRRFFASGQTLDLAFRKQSLLTLKRVIRAPDGFASRTDDLHAAPTPPSSAQHINQLGSGRSAG